MLLIIYYYFLIIVILFCDIKYQRNVYPKALNIIVKYFFNGHASNWNFFKTGHKEPLEAN